MAYRKLLGILALLVFVGCGSSAPTVGRDAAPEQEADGAPVDEGHVVAAIDGPVDTASTPDTFIPADVMEVPSPVDVAVDEARDVLPVDMSVDKAPDEPTGARLVADKPRVELTALTPCGPSASATVRITNAGNATTGVLGASLSAGFNVTANDCPGRTLGPGAACTIEITFTASARGTVDGNFTVTAYPGGQVVVELVGRGVGPESAVFTPSSLNFGSIVVDEPSAPLTMTLTNHGGSAVTLKGESVSSNQFAITGSSCGGILQPGETCTLTLAFRPTSVGDKMGEVTLVVAQGFCVVGTVSASLTGSGLPPPPPSGPARLVVSPQTIDFGWYDLTCPIKPSRTAHIGNRGATATGPLSVAVDGPFTVTNDGCSGAPLASGATCDVVLRYDAPGVPGAQSGVLTVKADPGGESKATILGAAVYGDGPVITPPFGSSGYPPTKVGTASAAGRFVFSMFIGSAPVTVTSVMTSGDFAIVADGCTGKIIHGGDRCPVDVVFQPTAVGWRDGSLTVHIPLDGCGDPAPQYPLAGTGTQ